MYIMLYATLFCVTQVRNGMPTQLHMTTESRVLTGGEVVAAVVSGMNWPQDVRERFESIDHSLHGRQLFRMSREAVLDWIGSRLEDTEKQRVAEYMMQMKAAAMAAGQELMTSDLRVLDNRQVVAAVVSGINWPSQEVRECIESMVVWGAPCGRQLMRMSREAVLDWIGSRLEDTEKQRVAEYMMQMKAADTAAGQELMMTELRELTGKEVVAAVVSGMNWPQDVRERFESIDHPICGKRLLRMSREAVLDWIGSRLEDTEKQRVAEYMMQMKAADTAAPPIRKLRVYHHYLRKHVDSVFSATTNPAIILDELWRPGELVLAAISIDARRRHQRMLPPFPSRIMQLEFTPLQLQRFTRSFITTTAGLLVAGLGDPVLRRMHAMMIIARVRSGVVSAVEVRPQDARRSRVLFFYRHFTLHTFANTCSL
jgi:hypothetical protein